MLKVDAWVWTHAVGFEPGELPVYAGYTYGGFSKDEFARFLKINFHPDMARLTAPLAADLQEKKCAITRTISQVAPPDVFMSSPVVPMWEDCGYFPHLLFIYPADDGTAAGTALYRREARRYFTEREARIAHIVLTEIKWLHYAPKKGQHLERVLTLSGRQRIVLEMLLMGGSRKFIADQLGISVNTVSGYIREIYRFYRVNTHGELIHRFFHGDGNDIHSHTERMVVS